jgi:hypothetical protein
LRKFGFDKSFDIVEHGKVLYMAHASVGRDIRHIVKPGVQRYWGAGGDQNLLRRV